MKIGLKPVLWSVVTIVLMLLLAVPGLNTVALLFMMVPYTVLYTLMNRKAFALHVLVIWMVSALALGASIVLLIGMFFLLPGIIMGHLYRSGAPATKIIPMITAVFLAQLMLELLVMEVFLDVSLLQELRIILHEFANQGLLVSALNGEMLDSFVATMLNMIPLAFMMLSYLVVTCSHYVARKIVARNGLLVQAFPEAKNWKLPRYFVIIYLIAYVFEMFIDRFDGSFMSVALLNLVPALSYIFAFQAIGFFFYLGDQKGWPKAISLIIAIPILLFPPLSIIGVIDTAFPLRKTFSKHK